MNDFDSRWQRLVVAARQAPVADEVAAPFGFATRVAARAMNATPAGRWRACSAGFRCARFTSPVC